MDELTQERLKEVLHYDPETGVFTRRITTNGNSKANSIAGSRHNKGYRRIMVDGKVYQSHRLAFLYMTGIMPEFVDHKNGIRDDNRWINLRTASATENMQNRKIHKNNTSGIPGVYWHKRRRMWHAHIKVNKKNLFLGCFSDLSEAANVVNDARERYFGEFARIDNVSPNFSTRTSDGAKS